MEPSFPRPDPTNGPRDLMFSRRSPLSRSLAVAIAIMAGAMAGSAGGRAGAQALLLVDVNTRNVVPAQNPSHPWDPPALTKLMPPYTTLPALRQGPHPLH